MSFENYHDSLHKTLYLPGINDDRNEDLFKAVLNPNAANLG